MRNSIIGIFIGTIVFMICLALVENTPYNAKDIRAIYVFIMFISMLIVGLSAVVLVYKLIIKYIWPPITKKSAEKELLKNKELFDKGILTQEEYEAKMQVLKEKIL